jgi:hypothetical protein
VHCCAKWLDADSLAAFLQLGMQPVQTVQAAEPITRGDMRPAPALRRNPAAVATSAQWSYQHDAHRCSTRPLTANQRLAVLEPSAGHIPVSGRLTHARQDFPAGDGAYAPAYPVYLRQLAYSLSALGGVPSVGFEP